MSTRSGALSSIALAATTPVATAIGAALGLAIVGIPPPPAGSIMVVGLGLIASGAVALVMSSGARGRVPVQPEPWPNRDPRRWQPAGYEAPRSPESAESGMPRARARPELVHQLLPVPSGQWWSQGAPMSSRETAPPPQRQVRGPELATYLDSSIVAQCPNCGGFLLDTADAPPGYRFGCRACAFRWEWHPGTPWPPVRVSPRLRGDHPASS